MTPFTRLPDLAAERLGGRAVAASDEFFGPKENLLVVHDPVWRPDAYTDHGKWMDGWETGRRRGPGHDWVVVRLGLAGSIHGIVVDTRHFKGNAPEAVRLDGCTSTPGTDGVEWTDAPWRTLLERTPVGADRINECPLDPSPPVTHVRLVIHPDGGVARLRVHGIAVPVQVDELEGSEVDLAGLGSGTIVAGCSDAFFGRPLNLIAPEEPEGMWDGWETRRRRGPGHDWVVLRLGTRGRIARAVVDTRHFKGNHPAACTLEAADLPGSGLDEIPPEERWNEILPLSDLGPDRVHVFAPPRLSIGEATHVRLAIHPDGGVARLRLFGEVAG